ncbi:hypothetical protein P389DRAFT_197120 [Cystobasidium minutum MCA 4210]|uniref:uncharacterized protein n=1 Tax=Cystobasidium minutum MCA 4210 TaxID=1397322 RepID=UPI0034CF4F0D|eukprot:jgi/Rhomi1/197120/gm1.5334_g
MSTSSSTAPAAGTSTSASALYSELGVKKPSSTTLALRKRVETFIDAQYKIWKSQKTKDVGTIATPDVLEAVKKTSTAFHCNESGGVDLLWLKKDMPREALKHAEVDYWTGRAGPGPKHEQEALVEIHGCPRNVMDIIRQTNDHELIAHFIYPFLDFWNLVEYHILIWIACVFFSGTICIIQPILMVCESSKIYRLFHDEYFIRIYVENITRELFQLFLTGQFDLAFLEALCVISIIIIIWDDLPLSPEDWLHCYGIPVVACYGPLPEHVGILIPKQHPYRPYHTMSLSIDYVDLDTCARFIIEAARKIVAAAPSPPNGHTRRNYMIKLRDKIMRECTRLGLLDDLRVAKKKMKKADITFRHHSIASGLKKSKETSEATGIPEEIIEIRVAAGKRAIEVRNERAVRAVGKPGSEERIQWAVEVLDDVRRKIEAGRSTQLLACPRTLQHGTADHAQWLIHNVSENADVINSASGTGQLATPTTQKEKEARDILQDKAGLSKFYPNSYEKSAVDILKALAEKEAPPSTTSYCAVTCPYCNDTWLIDVKNNRALHTCHVARKWFLPLLFDSHKRRLEAQAEDEAELKAVEEEVDNDAAQLVEAFQVTRVSMSGELPWPLGESITEDEDWDALKQNKPTRAKAKKNRTLKDPLFERALDDRGRLTCFCLKLDIFTTPAELLAHPLASSLFVNATPSPVPDVNFIALQAFVKDKNNKEVLAAANLSLDVLAAIPATPIIWLAVNAKMKAENAKRAIINQIGKYLQSKPIKCTLPRVSKEELETAARERIAMRKLRPYFFDWDTGADDYRPSVPTSASTSSAIPVASTSGSSSSKAPPLASQASIDEIAMLNYIFNP